jgi:hypothetical protein
MRQQEKVLISCGLTPFAQRIARQYPQWDFLFGSIEELPLPFQNHVGYQALPSPSHPAYVHEILKICLDRQVHAFLPLGVSEVHKLQEARVLFEEYGMALWMPVSTDPASLWSMIPPEKGTICQLKFSEDGSGRGEGVVLVNEQGVEQAVFASH